MSAPALFRRAPALLIADDQPLIRRGLAMILDAESDIDVVGQAIDGVDAIEQALALRPDVVVMDLQMPRASGVVATREITAKLPATGVVVLTTYDQDDLVFDAIRAGARAYLLKDASEAEVLETIRAVGRGSPRADDRAQVMEQFRAFAATPSSASPPPRGSHLSRRAADGQGPHPGADRPGLSNKQIGAKVFLAEGTEELRQPHHGKAPCSRTELAVRAEQLLTEFAGRREARRRRHDQVTRIA